MKIALSLSLCHNVPHVMKTPLSMDLVIVGQCQEQHFRVDITGTPEETFCWRRPRTCLTIAVLSYSIPTAVPHSAEERTVSLPLNSTAEMQAKLPAMSLNYNGTLQLQHRLRNAHFILFAISQRFISSFQASGQVPSCVLQNTAQLIGLYAHHITGGSFVRRTI